jgi:hypothetical protein
MELVDLQLFFGVPLTEDLEKSLGQVSLKFREVFIQPTEEYLREITHRDQRYIGKFIGDFADLPQLELAETHIYSILSKLVPNYPFKSLPLIVFPTNKVSNN